MRELNEIGDYVLIIFILSFVTTFFDSHFMFDHVDTQYNINIT